MNELIHAAIIMDGNGRWAEQRGKMRSFGHEAGAKSVEKITTYAAKIGLKYLTLYAFSTENWNRPESEVVFLMKLLKRFLITHLGVLRNNNIKFETIGNLDILDRGLRKKIEIVKDKTKDNSGLTQILAINYGSRDEIVRACKKLCESEDDINEQTLQANLDTKDIPPVDLLIRTGGERRLSNFLLWQVSYAELFFINTLWPDFNETHFEQIIQVYQKTQRKFGGL
ncbi:MAG: di-trans,poly-cis-decaprenylcistransferase [Campylobacteraceae bacterium]|nr:di-trans,poly-cis-decaprenylcistransferase [Campylobacteraceae bacterium]